MQEVIKLIIGMGILALAWPIGILLAKHTKEELKQGQKWFKILIAVSLIGAVVSIIFRQDALMFSFLFIAVVTSRSLKRR